MNEKVADISEALLTMTEEMRLMRETIDSQHSDICELNRNIGRLNAELHKRDKRIEELEKKLSAYESPDKNSGNSSTPPSNENISGVPRRCASLQSGSREARRGMGAVH